MRKCHYLIITDRDICNVTITFGVIEILLHNPRRIHHGGVAITYNAEEILV
jgi:hypothetical protein